MSVVGIFALTIAVLVFFLLPAYLGPNDLAQCQKTPTAQDINQDCQSADAIVAISGGDTHARTQEAIELYKNGWAPLLIFSGAAQDKSGPSNALAMKEQAHSQGVPDTAILLEETSVNTQENAAHTQALVAQYQLKKIILVTSAYHQRRAALEFQKRARNVLVVNHPVARDRQWSAQWYATPSGWWLVGGELVKIVGFYVSQ